MTLLIRKEGIFSSIQGLGNYGVQRFGINPGGAMDRSALRILNVILGNPDASQAIEMHFPAGEIVFESAQRFALGGADLSAQIDGSPITNWQVNEAAAGQTLQFRKRTFGNRCYLAVEGGISDYSRDGTLLENSFETRRLRTSDRLGLGESSDVFLIGRIAVSPRLLPEYSNRPIVRILAGAEFEQLSSISRAHFLNEEFALTVDSNRMGFRLTGPALDIIQPTEMVSSAVTFGTIQLPPDGSLIVLMADHQTSGGYPRIGAVVTADLPLLSQLGPGDRVRFQLVTIDAAERMAAAFEHDLKMLRAGVRFPRSK